MLKKIVALGIDDFKKVMKENIYFVDKSLFIKDFMADISEILVLPRPRRFGKTLNISMLKYFLDNKESSSDIFEGLEVSKDIEFCKKHLNKHPLIYIGLKDVKLNTWKESYKEIVNLIQLEYKRHINVLESLDAKEREVYNNILSEEAKEENIRKSLLNLTKYLEKHYGKKVIVLVDEYDATIHKAYIEGYYEKAINFFQMFYGSVFKGNIHLNKGLMTGILRISKESIFSGLNNAKVVTILENQYSQYFGFTEEETFKFVKNYGLSTDGIKDWYNGYQIGNYKMYNPWSINTYIDKRELGYYWVNTSSNDLIYDSVKLINVNVKRKLMTYLSGESSKEEIREDLSLRHLDSEDSFWSLLLFTGYLTWDREGSSRINITYRLKMPNQEVTMFFRRVLGTLSKTREKMKMLTEYIEEGRWKEFEEEFGEYIEETMSYYDLSEKSREKDYHLILLGMLLSLKENYEIRSNRESGEGRYDILLKCKEKDEGVVIELKRSDSKDKLEEDANKAIDQIEKRGYGRDIKELTKVGISFFGKASKVAYKKGKQIL